MKRQGISLVALVVTIIVLIILTGAVVTTFMEGGIIDRAKDAVKGSDYTTLVEAYSIKYNTAKINEVTGTGEVINEIKILKETVNELGLKGFSFNNELTEVEYTGDNEQILEWIIGNFKFEELTQLGYRFLVINGQVYLTMSIAEYSELLYSYQGGKIIERLPGGYELRGENVELKADIDGDGIDDDIGSIATGDTIEKDGEVYATILIKGDVAGTGVPGGDMTNALTVQSIINGDIEATDIQLIAADVNNDGYISMDDVYLIINSDMEAKTWQNQIKRKIPIVMSE